MTDHDHEAHVIKWENCGKRWAARSKTWITHFEMTRIRTRSRGMSVSLTCNDRRVIAPSWSLLVQTSQKMKSKRRLNACTVKNHLGEWNQSLQEGQFRDITKTYTCDPEILWLLTGWSIHHLNKWGFLTETSTTCIYICCNNGNMRDCHIYLTWLVW